jgi:hypothetical protein
VWATGLALAACAGGSGAKIGTEPATTTVTETATATTTVAAAPCGARALLPAVKGRLDDSATKLTVVRVRVTRCRNGHALVTAFPDRSVCQPGVADCYDPAQAYLAWNGTTWRVTDVGTDIACSSASLSPRMLGACTALGYPILTASTFQMPSRNIGCLLDGTRLRCDIRSGLKPPPSKPCRGDWGGIVMIARGAARANCAGDTVYDPAAPTLPYGSAWGGAGITCRSRSTSLTCTAFAGPHGFMLSRESWSAS